MNVFPTFSKQRLRDRFIFHSLFLTEENVFRTGRRCQSLWRTPPSNACGPPLLAFPLVECQCSSSSAHFWYYTVVKAKATRIEMEQLMEGVLILENIKSLLDFLWERSSITCHQAAKRGTHSSPSISFTVDTQSFFALRVTASSLWCLIHSPWQDALLH